MPAKNDNIESISNNKPEEVIEDLFQLLSSITY